MCVVWIITLAVTGLIIVYLVVGRTGLSVVVPGSQRNLPRASLSPVRASEKVGVFNLEVQHKVNLPLVVVVNVGFLEYVIVPYEEGIWAIRVFRMVDGKLRWWKDIGRNHCRTWIDSSQLSQLRRIGCVLTEREARLARNFQLLYYYISLYLSRWSFTEISQPYSSIESVVGLNVLHQFAGNSYPRALIGQQGLSHLIPL